MFKYGLKLWSNNQGYIEAVKKLYKERCFDYLELYVVPDTAEYLEVWKKLDVPYVIHATQWMGGMNLAKAEAEQNNMKLIKQSQMFADVLSAPKIILHSGIGGKTEETARQINKIGDKRFLIENKPYFGLGGGLLCNGSTPEEIRYIIKETGIGFCFDVGHAIVSANAHKEQWKGYLKEFIAMGPYMFHLSDGKTADVYDNHDHIGQGDFDLKYILSLLPEGSRVTIETKKDSENNLDDFIRDIEGLKGIEVSAEKNI